MGPGGAGQLPLDPAVAKRLDERGYLHRAVSDKEPLALDYLRQFSVVGLGAYYLLSYAFDEKRTEVGENSTGPLRGIAFERGDVKTPSDWGVLFDNLLRWAAEASTRAGLGGRPEPWATKLKPRSLPDEPIPDFAVVDWKKVELPPTWAHHAPNIVYWRGSPFYDEIPDPLVTKPQEMNKLLVGPRTRYSEGRGSIAQWAKAARAAGYRAIVFAERFEKLRAEDWPNIIADCERNSSKDFACLQGMDIADDYGNRYLILGNTNFPPKGILAPDARGLQQTSRLSLGFSGHIAVVHRLGNNKGLPTELCRQFQGVSVFTYADDGKGGYGLADDAFHAYTWQLFNASNPIPIVVHELTDPRQVPTAAATGFQQILPSQDALDAIRYFRYGLAHFFENPQRYFITEGPIIDKWAIFNKDIGSPEGMNPGPMAFLTRVDAGLCSRGAVSPTRPLFPIINSVPAGTQYRFVKDGQVVEGKLDGKAETLLDLPAGASLGDIFLLDPLTVSGKGEMGWRAEPGKEVPKRCWPWLSYMYVPWDWRSSLGAEGQAPWSLQLTQGKVERVLSYVNLAADNCGVAGTLKAGGEMKFLPLHIGGLKEQWPAALWTPEGLAYSFWSGLVKQAPLPGTTSGPPFLAHIGVEVEFGKAALPNTKDTPFYAGNTLMASNWNLVLAWTLWTATEAGIEVHNPTDEAIKARVWSDKAIPGKFVVDIEVNVPPGTT